MTISAIFILDRLAEPLLFRKYQPNVSATSIELFPTFLSNSEGKANIPIFFDEETNTHFLYVKNSNLYFVALTHTNTNAVMCFEFLHSLISVFDEYFHEIEEIGVLDNCCLIYELLDELMDSGVPQTTDAKILRQYIKRTSKSMALISRKPKITKVPMSVTNSVSWRSEGIQYKNNHCYLDIIEYSNVLISSNGNAAHNFVTGKVKINSKLSGMPELKLIFNDQVIFRINSFGDNHGSPIAPQMLYLEDVKFHQCVSLSKFDSHNIIKFIPPDGEFELMSYRIALENEPPFAVDAKYEKTDTTLTIDANVRSRYMNKSTAKYVEILLPVPNDIFKPQIKTSHGKCNYDPVKNCIVWVVRGLLSGRTYSITADVKLPTIHTNDNSSYFSKPILVKFEIHNFILSGINIRSLVITDKTDYHSASWIRYISRNGEYHVRIKR